MNVKDLYDAVKLRTSCSQNEFLTYFDQTVRTLIAEYHVSYVILRARIYGKPRTVNEDVPVYDEYYPAILNNVLFLLTGDVDRKSDFVAEAVAAYKSVWSVKARGVRFADRGYGCDV